MKKYIRCLLVTFLAIVGLNASNVDAVGLPSVSNIISFNGHIFNAKVTFKKVCLKGDLSYSCTNSELENGQLTDRGSYFYHMKLVNL